MKDRVLFENEAWDRKASRDTLERGSTNLPKIVCPSTGKGVSTPVSCVVYGAFVKLHA